jgi:hypothetical protein
MKQLCNKFSWDSGHTYKRKNQGWVVQNSDMQSPLTYVTSGSIHCNKKWAKRSFPLENNPTEEGKFPCGCWNIYPATHTVFIHYSVREKCSRIWTGTFYRSKKVNFLDLSLTEIFSGNLPHSVFLNDIFRKIPAFPRKNVFPGSSWKSLPYKT